MARSLIPWIGGKTQLAQHILRRMPKHERYVEPFFGGGAVFWAKDPSKVEVINDRDDHLVTLLRVVQRHPDALVDEILHLVWSRTLFDQAQESWDARWTDIERAARFWMVMRMAYSALVATKHTGMATTTHRPRITRGTVLASVDRAHERLASVLVENLDFEALLTWRWGKDTFAYCDPPYVGTEDVYEVQFTHEDHERLAGCLKAFSGRWLLSYHDHELVRSLYKGYRREAIRHKYSSGNVAGKSKPARELLIRNY